MGHAHLRWYVCKRIPYLIIPVRQLLREPFGIHGAIRVLHLKYLEYIAKLERGT